jgi:hypothetical protein
MKTGRICLGDALIDTSIDNHDARLRFNPRKWWQGECRRDTVMAYGLDLPTRFAGRNNIERA